LSEISGTTADNSRPEEASESSALVLRASVARRNLLESGFLALNAWCVRKTLLNPLISRQIRVVLRRQWGSFTWPGDFPWRGGADL